MKAFVWALTVVGSVLGGLVSVVGVLGAKGAPQEAAAAAIGVACAVIPYCFARAVSEISDSATSPASAALASMAENLIAIRKNTSQASRNVAANADSKNSAGQPSKVILPKIHD